MCQFKDMENFFSLFKLKLYLYLVNFYESLDRLKQKLREVFISNHYKRVLSNTLSSTKTGFMLNLSLDIVLLRFGISFLKKLLLESSSLHFSAFSLIVDFKLAPESVLNCSECAELGRLLKLKCLIRLITVP
jgi:hypothetical protein